MTTDFLEKLIPQGIDGRDDIIKKIFAEHGKTVNAEKAKYHNTKGTMAMEFIKLEYLRRKKNENQLESST